MFEVIFIITNIIVVLLAAPNPLDMHDPAQKTIENVNGKAKKLKIIATYGSGLKL